MKPECCVRHPLGSLFNLKLLLRSISPPQSQLPRSARAYQKSMNNPTTTLATQCSNASSRNQVSNMSLARPHRQNVPGLNSAKCNRGGCRYAKPPAYVSQTTEVAVLAVRDHAVCKCGFFPSLTCRRKSRVKRDILTAATWEPVRARWRWHRPTYCRIGNISVRLR